MGQTMAQKILANHSGRGHVEPGEVLYPKFDLAINHEVPFLEMWRELEGIGVKKIADPERMIIVWDHDIPVHSMKAAERQQKTRQLITQLGIGCIPPGKHGIQHQLLVEQGYALPGDLTVHMDIHCLNLGAVGCFAHPVVYEFPTVMATGTIWTMVPTSIKVHLRGRLPRGVKVRDLAHTVIAGIGPENGDYRSIEFYGDALAHLSMTDRMILCGVQVEIGAKAAMIPPDQLTLDYVNRVARRPYTPVYADPDAQYEQEYRFDLAAVEPLIAAPPAPDNVMPISQLLGKKVNSAYIGSCASGTIEELRDAAAVLRGRTVHPDVSMLVVPSTQETFIQASKEGLVEVFLEAGCQVLGPTCSPCFGGIFQMVDGETRISTGTRNDHGRMGAFDSEIYLASAATTAASAVTGEITDPREFFDPTLAAGKGR